jgi:hypothetical protein
MDVGTFPWQPNHVTAEKDTHAITEELLEVVFALRLNKESQLGLAGKEGTPKLKKVQCWELSPARTDDDTAHREDFTRAAVKCREHEFATEL